MSQNYWADLIEFDVLDELGNKFWLSKEGVSLSMEFYGVEND